MSKLHLLLVDDEPLIRKGLRDVLFAVPDVEITGECGSGEEAIQAITVKQLISFYSMYECRAAPGSMSYVKLAQRACLR